MVFRLAELDRTERFYTALLGQPPERAEDSRKEFIWLDDPDGMRIEFYLRP